MSWTRRLVHLEVPAPSFAEAHANELRPISELTHGVSSNSVISRIEDMVSMNATADLIERKINDALESIPRIRQAIIRFRQSKQALGVAQYYRILFEEHLSIAFLQWRLLGQDPKNALLDAVGVCREFLGVAPSLGEAALTQTLWAQFPFAMAAFADFVIRSQIDEAILSGLAPWEDRARQAWIAHGTLSHRFLEAGLVHGLVSGKLPAEWDEFLSNVAAKVKSKLTYETYKTYGQIVTDATRVPGIDVKAIIDRAAANFRKRKTNLYFSGGSFISAGGIYNDRSVDLILAALIRRFVPDQGLSLTGDAAIHVWRW